MVRFISELKARLKDDDTVWVIESPLIYESDIVGLIRVPAGFETDFASVPRVPIAYTIFGDRAHREAVIHDYLYRIDSFPAVPKNLADDVFLEAMTVRGKSWIIRKIMYWAVCSAGCFSWHKRRVDDKL